MKFAVKHSCQYNENTTQKMYGKCKKEEREAGKREGGRKKVRSRREKERREGRRREGGKEGINHVCLQFYTEQNFKFKLNLHLAIIPIISYIFL